LHALLVLDCKGAYYHSFSSLIWSFLLNPHFNRLINSYIFARIFFSNKFNMLYFTRNIQLLVIISFSNKVIFFCTHSLPQQTIVIFFIKYCTSL
jgi:hypothetical protein